jgi:hypothetical protein
MYFYLVSRIIQIRKADDIIVESAMKATLTPGGGREPAFYTTVSPARWSAAAGMFEPAGRITRGKGWSSIAGKSGGHCFPASRMGRPDGPTLWKNDQLPGTVETRC